MRALLTILLVFVLFASSNSSYAFGEGWTSKDTKLMMISTVLDFIDYKQTKKFTRERLAEEMNPLLGKYPSPKRVNRYFALAVAGSWLFAYALPPRWRRRFEYYSISVEIFCIVDNYRLVGLGTSFRRVSIQVCKNWT